jgi:hypothetical protein
MNKNKASIISIYLSIFSLILDLNLWVTINFSDKLLFYFLLKILDYINIIAFFMTWFFSGLAIVFGIIGLKVEKSIWAKYGIGLAVLGLLIYILLILSLYWRLG